MNGSGSRIDIGALPGRPCSAAAALQVVGEKWTLLAVREIFFGNHRFEAIARNTGAPGTGSRPGCGRWSTPAWSSGARTTSGRRATSTT